MTNQRANKTRHKTAAKGHQQVDPERLGTANYWADLIWRENHFHLIKMHYQGHLS